LEGAAIKFQVSWPLQNSAHPTGHGLTDPPERGFITEDFSGGPCADQAGQTAAHPVLLSPIKIPPRHSRIPEFFIGHALLQVKIILFYFAGDIAVRFIKAGIVHCGIPLQFFCFV
jgi:hypothetical protein